MGDARSKAVTMASRKKAFRRKERITPSFLQAAGAVAVPRLHPSQSPRAFDPVPCFSSRPPDSFQHPGYTALHCTTSRGEKQARTAPPRGGGEG